MRTPAKQEGDVPSSAGRRLRADARRNYDRLVAAADAVLNEHGPEASLEDVARRADVSIATLYRHFPTRQDLVEVVFLKIADTLRDQAVALLDEDDPVAAFVHWLRLHMESGACGRGLAASVMSAKLEEGTPVNIGCVEMKQAGQTLLERAAATGRIRSDINLGDLLLVVHGIVLINEQLPTSPDRPEHMLKVVLDGVRRQQE